MSLHAKSKAAHALYNLKFKFTLHTMGGDSLVDHRGDPIGPIRTNWFMSFDDVWRKVGHYTHGRALGMLIKHVMVTPLNRDSFKWSCAISREDVHLARGAINVTVLYGRHRFHL